jgi:hypothetical protein
VSKDGNPAWTRSVYTSVEGWHVLAERPDQQEAFAGAMRLQDDLLSATCVPPMDLSGVETIADVGGGTGDLLGAILEARPGVHGILVDRLRSRNRTGPLRRPASGAPRKAVPTSTG